MYHSVTRRPLVRCGRSAHVEQAAVGPLRRVDFVNTFKRQLKTVLFAHAGLISFLDFRLRILLGALVVFRALNLDFLQ